LGARAVRGLLGAARAVTESLDRRIPTPPSVGASAEAGVKPYLRFWMSVLSPLVNVFYRPRVRGLENLPKGGALLLSNHVSFLDVVMLHFATRRPIRFLMFSDYYENPYLHWFVKQFRPIPIRPKEYGGNKEAILQALQDAKEAAQQGDLVLIFPEGTLTPHGMLTEFKRGFEYIAHDLGRPVIPIYLDGLWRSIFSRGRAKSLWENVKDLVAAPFGDVSIRFGKPLEQPDIAHAFQAEMELGVASFTERVARSKRTIPRELVRVAKAHWATKAVVDSTGKLLSYGKLLTASILLSGLLGGLFAGRGLSAADTKNVGVLLPPTAGGVLANAALGIRGSVPVNLNYTASAESIDNALSKTNARVILTSRKFLAALEEKAKKDRAPFFWSDYKSRFVFVEDLAAGVPKWKSALLFVLLTILPTFLVEHFFLRSASRDLNDTAAIVFTSGSSGLGNGAELSHMNIQSNIEMLREIFPMKNLRSFLGVLPFFHVFGFTVTMWMPLMLGMGAAYHVHPREYEHIETLAAAQRPDILIATPTFLAEYTQHVAKAALSSLKLVIVGASALPEDVRQAFLAKFGVVPLEGYGATEFSPVVSVNVPDDGDGVGNVPGTVGHFLPGTAVAVVDPATFQLVPFGEPGVLLVAGPHVMKGYIGEPEKTARNARGPWRMTGDIATLDAKGFIRILGRVERFAKVMGEKVDLEGVERKLNAAAGAGRAVFAVTSVPDPKLGERLVVLNAGYEGNIDLLLARLIEQGVPHLWLPTTNSFYRVPELPMLGSGKLDLRRLKELALQLSAR
jgi:acyl-[acyl-carrier-protein]-phospholipid O-acyltransferase/long-chain-fatty-acid--[acyl-carrier-protein] ligase